MQLPQQVDGRTLHWSYPQEGTVRMLLVILLILPAAFWVHEDSKVRENAKARKGQMELDYSQLLWKMTMLLSAGLTIRGAFTRIAAQYQAQTGTSETLYGSAASITPKKLKRPAGQKHYVYEEMILTLREMRSGVPEASAYENFGRRCGLPSYIKLGSLLSQNLKKGSKGLTSLLEHEAVLSLEQHKMAVRKMGEKAGIRMLLPMIMMFSVVLVILMVPAFLSM
jgi:pilus assembly protein TadC